MHLFAQNANRILGGNQSITAYCAVDTQHSKFTRLAEISRLLGLPGPNRNHSHAPRGTFDRVICPIGVSFFCEGSNWNLIRRQLPKFWYSIIVWLQLVLYLTNSSYPVACWCAGVYCPWSATEYDRLAVLSLSFLVFFSFLNCSQ